jgi:DNA-binding IclR family transcriptional regulator
MKRPNQATQARHKAGSPSPASQTLVRGLDVLEVVAGGPVALPALAHRLGLARSTTHRLATALLERRYLTLVPREGYGLGPKLLELGSCAQEQTALVRVARPYMESLAAKSLDTVLLYVRDGGASGRVGALLLERVAGHRRLLPALRIGERMDITAGAPGYALLIDETEDGWRAAFSADTGADSRAADFLGGMRKFAALGYTLDMADPVEGVRSVAAPVRDARGVIVASLGLASAAHYLDDTRLAMLGAAVAGAASLLSADLGYPASPAQTRHTIATANAPAEAAAVGASRDNERFGRAGATRHLEAGALSVHDPASQVSRRAANPDNSMTLRPASSAPAKGG